MLCVKKLGFLIGKQAISHDDFLFGNWPLTEICIFQKRIAIFKLSSYFKEGVDVFSYHVQYNSNHHEIRGVIESIRCWRSRCQLGENQPPAAMIGELVSKCLHVSKCTCFKVRVSDFEEDTSSESEWEWRREPTVRADGESECEWVREPTVRVSDWVREPTVRVSERNR